MEIPLNRERIRVWLLGSRTSYGVLFTVFLYLLLIAIGFVYLYPLLFMFVTSIKSPQDLLNPMVQWVPTELYLGNYVKAFRVLNYPVNLMNTILVSVAPSLIQTLVCSVIGYGLARYRFPGKHLVMGLILATFIIPPADHRYPPDAHLPRTGVAGQYPFSHPASHLWTGLP